MDRIYVAIDLKSFYASVECVERKLDPLQTNLVVADPTRTEKTICLAVSPSLKKYGIPGRARLFEVVQKVEQINNDRRYKALGRKLTGKSIWGFELERHPELEVDYVVAPPQMAHYMKVSSQIYGIYLKYVAPEDIFAYSIDEVFIDATSYLDIYHLNAHDFTRMLIKDVLHTTGITATAGIGPNMFLCKVAMDIVAKHIPADRDGVRIAELTEQKYKELLWEHTPLTDFWRVGRGTASRIAKIGLYTMGDIARCSLNRQSLGQLYKLLGKNTELLVDHAWGIEPTTIKDVKAYEPDNNSTSTGQVLKEPTDYETTRLIVWEMADTLSLDRERDRHGSDRAHDRLRPREPCKWQIHGRSRHGLLRQRGSQARARHDQSGQAHVVDKAHNGGGHEALRRDRRPGSSQPPLRDRRVQRNK